MNDCDTEKAKSKILEERFPCIDFTFFGMKPVDPATIPAPRLLKVHLPYSLLPQSVKDKKCKIIYISRNPKDLMVSYYFFLRMFKAVKMDFSFKEAGKLFLANRAPYGPYWRHTLEAWQASKHSPDTVLFVKYEDLKKSPEENIMKIADFLGKPLTEEKVTLIKEATSFKKMKDNPQSNYSWLDKTGEYKPEEEKFMRKGTVGDWRNYFDDELSMMFDAEYKKYFGETGIHHDFEL